MKRGMWKWALLFHGSRCCWSVASLYVNQGSKLCRGTEDNSCFVFLQEYPKTGAWQRAIVNNHPYHLRQSCRHRRCRRPWGKSRSRRRSVRVHWPWSSAGTAWGQWTVSLCPPSEQRSFHELLWCVLLQLILLNETTLVLVDDAEGLLDFLSALAGHATCMEELLVVEWARVCNEDTATL